MKFLIPLLLICVGGCIQPQNGNEIKNLETVNNQVSQDFDESLLLANWSVCHVKDDTMSVSFFICPEIRFEENGLGEITLAMTKRVSFWWQFENGFLVLEDSTGKLPFPFFGSTNKLNVEKTIENGLHYLVLKDPTKGIRHFLAKKD